MSSQPIAFLFDRDFLEEERASLIPPPELYSEKDLQDAKARGQEEALENHLVRQNEVLIAMSQEISGKISAALATLDQERQELINESISLAAEIGRKLSGTALDIISTKNLESLVSEVIYEIRDQPVVRIEGNFGDTSGLREKLMAELAGAGFTGRLIFDTKPGVPLSDCKIHWAKGGISFRREELEVKFDELFERLRYLLIQSLGEIEPDHENSENETVAPGIAEETAEVAAPAEDSTEDENLSEEVMEEQAAPAGISPDESALELKDEISAAELQEDDQEKDE